MSLNIYENQTVGALVLLRSMLGLNQFFDWRKRQQRKAKPVELALFSQAGPFAPQQKWWWHPKKFLAITSMHLSGHQLCCSGLPGPAQHRSCGRSGSKASDALSDSLRLQERSIHLQRGKPFVSQSWGGRTWRHPATAVSLCQVAPACPLPPSLFSTVLGAILGVF